MGGEDDSPKLTLECAGKMLSCQVASAEALQLVRGEPPHSRYDIVAVNKGQRHSIVFAADHDVGRVAEGAGWHNLEEERR